jgi:hypothetical protein
MGETKTIWAFDLGTGSIGEAVRDGAKFLHKILLWLLEPLSENNNGAVPFARKPRMEVIVCLAAGGLALPNL